MTTPQITRPFVYLPPLSRSQGQAPETKRERARLCRIRCAASLYSPRPSSVARQPTHTQSLYLSASRFCHNVPCQARPRKSLSVKHPTSSRLANHDLQGTCTCTRASTWLHPPRVPFAKAVRLPASLSSTPATSPVVVAGANGNANPQFLAPKPRAQYAREGPDQCFRASIAFPTTICSRATSSRANQPASQPCGAVCLTCILQTHPCYIQEVRNPQTYLASCSLVSFSLV